jgi:hypothetical protein
MNKKWLSVNFNDANGQRMHNHAYAQHKRSSLCMYAQHSKVNILFISSAYTQKVYA